MNVILSPRKALQTSFEGCGGLRQKWDVIRRRGWRLASVLDVFWDVLFFSFLFFFIKGNWICSMTRHHVEPNINILVTRNLPFESNIGQWSHPLMIPLHCFWTKSNNRTGGQFECDVIRFILILLFHMHVVVFVPYGGIFLKFDVQSQKGGRILNVDGQGGVEGLENWTIFMDVICASSLTTTAKSWISPCEYEKTFCMQQIF